MRWLGRGSRGEPVFYTLDSFHLRWIFLHARLLLPLLLLSLFTRYLLNRLTFFRFPLNTLANLPHRRIAHYPRHVGE